jgi:hypothetical protein
MMRILALILCLIFAPVTGAIAKDVLVLLPLNVDKSLEAEAALLGTALQQGLSNRFDVFYGPAVESKLEEEYSKEGCTAQSCAQGLAVAFNGELIADSSVQKLDDSYVVQLQINNIISGRIEKSLIEICTACSKLSLISFMKQAGRKAAETASPDPTLGAPAPSGRRLEINTGSFDTQVYIDGTDIGRAPLTTPMSYRDGTRLDIRLATPGYQDLQFSHIVGRNDAQLKNINLVRNLRDLDIASNPRRSELFVDGQRIGTTPSRVKGLELGSSITLELRKDGYETLRLTHTVGRNDDWLQELKLIKQKAKLYIDSQPRGGKIYVDRRFVGETPAEIGPYEGGKKLRIRVTREGYDDYESRHQVGRRDDELSQIKLRAQDSQADEKQKIRVPMGF